MTSTLHFSRRKVCTSAPGVNESGSTNGPARVRTLSRCDHRPSQLATCGPCGSAHVLFWIVGLRTPGIVAGELTEKQRIDHASPTGSTPRI